MICCFKKIYICACNPVFGPPGSEKCGGRTFLPFGRYERRSLNFVTYGKD